MENFVEYSLPYRLTSADQLKRAVYSVAPMALGVLLIMYLGVIGMIITLGLCWLSFRLYIGFLFEWEYTLLEDEIRFGKIINKERRKEMLTASIGKTVEFGPIENKPASLGCKAVSFLSHQGDLPEYYWITFTEKGEKVCILFQPNARILEVFDLRARGKRR